MTLRRRKQSPSTAQQAPEPKSTPVNERTPFWTATTSDDGHNVNIALNAKLPAALVQQAHAFFATTWQTRGTEALLLIYCDPNTLDFRLVAPPQHNTSGSVNADPIPAPEGYDEIGSIHSHPGSAFHSPTDVHDEQQTEGIHIVFGHVQRFVPEVVAAISIQGRRYPISPADVIELPWEYHGPWSEQLHGEPS
jgi:hypothetical protein